MIHFDLQQSILFEHLESRITQEKGISNAFIKGRENLYKNFAGLNGIRSPEKTAEKMVSKSQVIMLVTEKIVPQCRRMKQCL